MRFSDMMIEYRLRKKELKTRIPFKDLPPIRQLALIWLFSMLPIFLFFYFYQFNTYATLSFWCVFMIGLFVLVTVDDRTNAKDMLGNHYKKYSQKRIQTMLTLLKDYGIDYLDTNQLDLLIDAAKTAKSERDYYPSIHKNISAVCAVISSIIIYIAKKYVEDLEEPDLIILSLQAIVLVLLVYILYFSFNYLLKIALQSDCKIYDDFISDVQQIKLFKGRLYSEEQPSDPLLQTENA